MLKEMCATSFSANAECVVLILILVEHAQRDVLTYDENGNPAVLILILVEHAQRECKALCMNNMYSLNPYFSGICSKRH